MRRSRNNKRSSAATLSRARRQKNINPMPVVRARARHQAYSTSSRCVVCPTESYASKFPTCMINALPESCRAPSQHQRVRRRPSPSPPLSRCQRRTGEPGGGEEETKKEKREKGYREIPLTRAKISLIGTFLAFGETPVGFACFPA